MTTNLKVSTEFLLENVKKYHIICSRKTEWYKDIIIFVSEWKRYLNENDIFLYLIWMSLIFFYSISFFLTHARMKYTQALVHTRTFGLYMYIYIW